MINCFQSRVKCVLIFAVTMSLIQEAASGSMNLCRGYDCRDGTCVGSSLLFVRCDDITQCPDGSDEFRCGYCDNGFPCDNGECTSSILERCNGVQDCSDGSDEDNCGANLIGVIIGSVVGGMVLFVCCPFVIIVSIVCCVLCCIVDQSNRQVKIKRASDTTQKVPLTTAPGTGVPVAGQPQSYPLQPTASAPPLDTVGADVEYPPQDQQYPQPSAPYPTNPPPPYPGTAESHPIESTNVKEPFPLQ